MGIKHSICNEYRRRGFVADTMAYQNIILVLVGNATEYELIEIAKSFGVIPRVIPSKSFPKWLEVSWLETLGSKPYNTALVPYGYFNTIRR